MDNQQIVIALHNTADRIRNGQETELVGGIEGLLGEAEEFIVLQHNRMRYLETALQQTKDNLEETKSSRDSLAVDYGRAMEDKDVFRRCLEYILDNQ
jgi:hypothetical protein